MAVDSNIEKRIYKRVFLPRPLPKSEESPGFALQLIDTLFNQALCSHSKTNTRNSPLHHVAIMQLLALIAMLALPNAISALPWSGAHEKSQEHMAVDVPNEDIT